MKLLILCVCSMLLMAEEPFEVRQIDASQVADLKQAEDEVDAALKQFAAAQERLAKARIGHASVKNRIVSPFNPTEGQCVYPNTSGSLTVYYQATKTFRRVEIRGKYALITNGSEGCGSGVVWQNTYTAPAITATSPLIGMTQ